MLGKSAKLQGIPGKHEPATLPRVSELMVVSRDSPWTTTIRNEQGVTVGDVWIGIFRDYYEHNLADHEFNSLTARASEILRRTSLLHERSDLIHDRDNVSRSATHQQCWNIDDWTIADRFRRIGAFFFPMCGSCLIYMMNCRLLKTSNILQRACPGRSLHSRTTGLQTI